MLLLVATENVHKLAELRTLLAGRGWNVRGASELGVPIPKVVEDGATFEANAIKKAEAIARATFAVTLADDSGLEVDILGGKPGVRSARYAHERATDAENNAALLEALRPYEGERITARFRCVLCLINPYSSERQFLVSGACEGEITTAARGNHGFGYDPLFVPDGYTESYAELGDAVKNTISHRGRAWAKLAAWAGTKRSFS